MDIDLYRTSLNAAGQRLTATFAISFVAVAANAALALFAAPAAVSGRVLISLIALAIALYVSLAVVDITSELKALRSDLDADGSAFSRLAETMPLGLWSALTVILQVLILLATLWVVWT